jgi:uncharacterized protein
MSYIIDRRLNSKNKSAVNRTRFLGRYRSHIKKAVEEAVTKRSITDIDSGENIVKKTFQNPPFVMVKAVSVTSSHLGIKNIFPAIKFSAPQGAVDLVLAVEMPVIQAMAWTNLPFKLRKKNF